MLIDFMVQWEFILFNFDSQCQIYVPKIIMMVEIQIFVNFDISEILPPWEHVFWVSIRKSVRKWILLHQMKYNILCKTSHFSLAIPSILAFTVVAGQAIHPSAVTYIFLMTLPLGLLWENLQYIIDLLLVLHTDMQEIRSFFSFLV